VAALSNPTAANPRTTHRTDSCRRARMTRIATAADSSSRLNCSCGSILIGVALRKRPRPDALGRDRG
jgi:hypothetical protein